MSNETGTSVGEREDGAEIHAYEVLCGEGDPAAVLAICLGLVKECREEDAVVDLSATFNGGDEFLRQVVRVATMFENWACAHVHFDALDTNWVYLLETRFAREFLMAFSVQHIMEFSSADCLVMARFLGLPVIYDATCPVPFDFYMHGLEHETIEALKVEAKCLRFKDATGGAERSSEAGVTMTWEHALERDEPLPVAYLQVSAKLRSAEWFDVARHDTWEQAARVLHLIAPGRNLPEIAYSKPAIND